MFTTCSKKKSQFLICPYLSTVFAIYYLLSHRNTMKFILIFTLVISAVYALPAESADYMVSSSHSSHAPSPSRD